MNEGTDAATLAAANTNSLVVILVTVVFVLLVALVINFRWIRPRRKKIDELPRSEAPGAGGTPPAPATDSTTPPAKPFWQKGWFQWSLGILALILIGLAVLYLLGYLGAYLPTPPEDGLPLPSPPAISESVWLGIGLIAAALLLLSLIGKKAAAKMLAGIAILAALILWIGPDNFITWGNNIGSRLSGEGGTGVVARSSCPGEQVVTLQPNEPVTVSRDPGCSYHLQMRWKPKKSATVQIAVAGTVGVKEYTRLPNTKSDFEYDGVVETLTLTNLDEMPTSTLVFYK